MHGKENVLQADYIYAALPSCKAVILEQEGMERKKEVPFDSLQLYKEATPKLKRECFKSSWQIETKMSLPQPIMRWCCENTNSSPVGSKRFYLV